MVRSPYALCTAVSAIIRHDEQKKGIARWCPMQAHHNQMRHLNTINVIYTVVSLKAQLNLIGFAQRTGSAKPALALSTWNQVMVSIKLIVRIRFSGRCIKYAIICGRISLSYKITSTHLNGIFFFIYTCHCLITCSLLQSSHHHSFRSFLIPLLQPSKVYTFHSIRNKKK